MFTLVNDLHAQIVNKFGIALGVNFSNQLWDYKKLAVNNANKDTKTGVSACFSVEKILSQNLGLRGQLGYIQKGFKNNIEYTFYNGGSADAFGKNVTLHDMEAAFALKLTPAGFAKHIFFICGLRADYMFAFRDIKVVEPGSGIAWNIYSSELNSFNRFNLGGIITAGIDLKDHLYIELEFNPAITSSLNTEALRVRDNCWGIKVGYNWLWKRDKGTKEDNGNFY
jgi:hypothetical protein